MNCETRVTFKNALRNLAGLACLIKALGAIIILVENSFELKKESRKTSKRVDIIHRVKRGRAKGSDVVS